MLTKAKTQQKVKELISSNNIRLIKRPSETIHICTANGKVIGLGHSWEDCLEMVIVNVFNAWLGERDITPSTDYGPDFVQLALTWYEKRTQWEITFPKEELDYESLV